MLRARRVITWKGHNLSFTSITWELWRLSLKVEHRKIPHILPSLPLTLQSAVQILRSLSQWALGGPHGPRASMCHSLSTPGWQAPRPSLTGEAIGEATGAATATAHLPPAYSSRAGSISESSHQHCCFPHFSLDRVSDPLHQCARQGLVDGGAGSGTWPGNAPNILPLHRSHSSNDHNSLGPAWPVTQVHWRATVRGRRHHTMSRILMHRLLRVPEASEPLETS